MTHPEASSNGLIELTRAESDNAAYAGGIQQGGHNVHTYQYIDIHVYIHHQAPLS